MEKKLTPKSFMRKLSTKAAKNAVKFIDEYKDYLVNGEVAVVTKDILNKMSTGLAATPALEEIKNNVWAYIQACDVARADEQIKRSMEKASNPQSKSNKHFIARILNEKGELQEYINRSGDRDYLDKNFDLPQEAERFLVRRLVDGAPDWHGEIIYFDTIWSTMNRDQAYYEFYKKGPRTVLKKSPKNAPLSNSFKAVQTKSYFSRG